MEKPDPVAGPLVDALLLEQRRRWEARAPLRVEDILQKHPELSAQTDALLDLINHEIVLRCEFETPPAPAEYIERFPGLKDDLQMLFEVQAAIEEDTSRVSHVKRPPSLGRRTQRISSGTLDLTTVVHKTPLAATGGRPQLPNYAISDTLGEGGMGVVYKATDERLKRIVALKMIRSGRAGAEERRRFQIEAEAVARLDHPGIVHIYEIGEYDDQPFFALEYLDGGSLADRLQGMPQPPVASARLIEMLARAVHSAHAQGIIHRDLKPANILLQKVGDSPSQLGSVSAWAHAGVAYLPKVADFGLAKHVQNHADATQTHAIVGTPSYMAPEQAGDFSRRIGPAADVYSLGAILYEMITGRPPFRGETVLDTLDQVRSQDPVPPSRLQPRMPRDLETICLKCLRKDPAYRYTSAEALAEDLGRFLRHEPIKARPTSTLQAFRLWCRRHPAVARLLATIFCLITISLVTFIYLWRHAAAGEEYARTQLYDTRIGVAQRHWNEAQCNRMHWLLDSLKPQPGDTDRRGFEWYYLDGLLKKDVGRVTADAGLAYHPDGTDLAAGVKDEIRLWKSADLEAGAEPQASVSLQGHGATVTALAFGPKGKRLLSAAKDRTVRVWDVVKREPIQVLLTHAAEVTAVAFDQTAGLMASACADGVIRLWEPDGTLRLQLDEHAGPVNDIAFTRDGLRLISAGNDKALIIWDVATGDVLYKVNADAVKVTSVAAAPNGEYIASAGWDRKIRLWDSQGKLLNVFPPSPHLMVRLAISPDSKRIACGCFDKTIRIWNVDPALAKFDEEPLFILKGHTDRVESVAFSPTQNRLASISPDRKLRVWISNQAEESRAINLPAVANSMAVLPGQDWIAVASRDKTVRLWNWRTQEHKVLHGHAHAVHSVAFASDGTLASVSDEGQIRFWDIAQTKSLRELAGDGKPVFGFALDPRGQAYATGANDGVVHVWDAATGRELYQGPTHGGAVHSLNFDPAGRWLASASANGKDSTQGFVIVCDARTGQEYRRFTDPYRTPVALAFSSDGRLLASGDKQFTIRVWDVRGNRRLCQMEGHDGQVVAVAFSRDGQRLGSASEDGTIRIWDVATGMELLTLRGHGREANGVAFIEDDTTVLSLGRPPAEFSQLRLWESGKRAPASSGP